MKTTLVVLQVIAGLLSAWPHKKPAPRPTVIVTDLADGDVSIMVTCPALYVVKYTATEIPETVAQRVNVANAATCVKAPKH